MVVVLRALAAGSACILLSVFNSLFYVYFLLNSLHNRGLGE